ncbi:MAG: two-component regulator propeller domain-containing protein [Saprospiraceae bacterium]
MRRLTAILFLLACLLSATGAQTPFFKTYELGESYFGVVVEQVFEDRNSAMLVGTTEGLFLFDGMEFKPYLKSDSSSNHVGAIYRDHNDRLWVGYDDGSIYHLINHRLQKWMPEEGLPGAAITGFAEDGEGRLWIATYGEGAYYLDGRRMYNVNMDDGLLGDDIYAMKKDRKGRVWVGTDGGVNICSVQQEQKNIRQLTRSDGLPDDIVRVLLPDASGNMWIGTYDGGFCYYNVKKETISYPEEEWTHGIVSSLALFEGIEVWVGTEGNGLWRYSLGQKEILPVEGWDKAKIFDLQKDIEGNIWVVSNFRSLCSANRQFEFIHTELEDAQAVLFDAEDRLWVGTAHGLFIRHRNPKGESEFRQYLSDVRLNVLSLFEDMYGNLWIGTFGQGLYCYHLPTGRLRHLTEQDGLTNGNILSMDGIGNRIWLATLGGVTEIEYPDNIFSGSPLRFRNFNEEDGLGTNFMYKVFADRKGRVWFGTDGEGISVLEAGVVKSYPVAIYSHPGGDRRKETPLQSVYSITEDHRGHIWLSTAKGGIFEFDGKRFSHLSVKKSRHDLETSLATDANGQILIVHPGEVDILTPETRHLIYYDEDVGIHDMDLNLNAVCTDRHGNLWLGARKAIIKYTALNEQLEIHPRTLLNGVAVFLDTIDFESTHSFTHNQNNLVFSYMGLWYTDPATVKYRYQLSGYDIDWIETKDRQVTYSNLPPGEYTFRVTSTENDAWSDEPVVAYAFEVELPFWQKWWFIAACLFVAGGLSYWYIKARDQRVQNVTMLEKEKAESQLAALKAQINPHFLFNSFNTLATVIEEDPVSAVQYVEKMSDFYRSMMQVRDKEVISIQEEVELVRNYSYLLEKRYGKNFHLDIRLNGEPYYIVPLTLQILVENAVKHNVISKSKPLTVGIAAEGGEYITVTNNLQRKINAEKSTRFGLQSLIKRYDLLGNKKVKIEETGGYFKISIPVIR